MDEMSRDLFDAVDWDAIDGLGCGVAEQDEVEC